MVSTVASADHVACAGLTSFQVGPRYEPRSRCGLGTSLVPGGAKVRASFQVGPGYEPHSTGYEPRSRWGLGMSLV